MSIVTRGAAVRIRPDRLEEYLAVHANQPDAVRQGMLRTTLNYTMFLMRSESLVFSFSQYDPALRAANSAINAADPAMRDWQTLCRSMQVRLPGEEQHPENLWSQLPEVYRLV